MARYATADQVRDELCADRAQPDGTAAELDTVKLEDCADAASAEVDAALGTAGYTVPTETGTFPRLVREVTAALAAQDADLTYREGKPQADGNPVLRRYEWAQAMLAAWAKGERLPLGLTQPVGGESSDLQVGEVVNTVPELFDCSMLEPVDPWPVDGFYDPDYFRHWSS